MPTAKRRFARYCRWCARLRVASAGSCHVTTMTLVGDGSIGLIRAVDDYDPSRGTSLELYARHLISGAMLNGIRRMDPVSERTRRAMRDGEVERYQLACARGNVPTLAEMEIRRPGFIRASAAVTQGAIPSTVRFPKGNGCSEIGATTRRSSSRRATNVTSSARPSMPCRFVSARLFTSITLANGRCAKCGGCGSHRSALHNCTSLRCASCARIYGISMLRRLDGEEGRAHAAEPHATAIATEQMVAAVARARRKPRCCPAIIPNGPAMR